VTLAAAGGPGCKVDARVDDEGRLISTPVLCEPEELLALRPPPPARSASMREHTVLKRR
jgi:hypothetical protein